LARKGGGGKRETRNTRKYEKKITNQKLQAPSPQNLLGYIPVKGTRGNQRHDGEEPESDRVRKGSGKLPRTRGEHSKQHDKKGSAKSFIKTKPEGRRGENRHTVPEWGIAANTA